MNFGMESDKEQLLKRLSSITPIPPDEARYFLENLGRKTLMKGDFFTRAGNQVTELGYMVTGLIRYFYISEEGKEYTRHFCTCNNFVSSTPGILEAEPSNYFIQALERTELLIIRYQTWKELLNRNSVWGIIGTRLLGNTLRAAELRERTLILDSAETRYRALLKDFPDIESRVKLYDIANYLGITPVALSRIRARMKKTN